MKRFISDTVPSFFSQIPTRARAARSGKSGFAVRKAGLLLSVLGLGVASANATPYYVDSAAGGGTHNGTSWATAWTSISSISGVKGGDIVYISGGPSGSSQSYSISGTWTPTGGSSGNPVTYQIGQDSAHNGTANFTGGGSGYWTTPSSYTVISGDAGDGQMHFSVSGSGGCANIGNTSGVRIAYINFGNISFGVDSSSVGGTGFEFDHNYVYINGMSTDHFMGIHPYDTAYDGTKIHDNTVWIPRLSAQVGADGFQINGSGGWSLYNNKVNAYLASYTAGQHQDGVQTLGGSYFKIYGNTFSDMANSSIFLDGYGGTFNHARVYNNICQFTSSSLNDYAEFIQAGADGQPAGTPGFTDIIICNNLLADNGSSSGIAFGNCPQCNNGNPTPYNSCYAYNNVFVNSGSLQIYSSPIITGNNVQLTSAQGQTYFVQYKTLSPANDYHPTSGATSLINAGANESTFFTTDKDGNNRPASGSWSIGPYQYGATGGSTNPVANLAVSPISVNAADVDQTSSGMQVYEGTTVLYSATATETGTNVVSWHWTYTLNGGSPVTFQSGTGTIPAVSFNYPTGTAGNSYLWTISASDGVNTQNSSLTMSVEAPPVAGVGLSFLAPSGVITSPMSVTGNYISQSVTTTTIAGDGLATYNFNITNAGNYVVQALINAPSDSANSMYVNIDALPVDPTMCWDIFPLTSGFENRIASWRGTGTDTNNQYIPKVFNLTAGAHQIIFAGREAGVQLQSFSILQLPGSPQNLRILSGVSSGAPTFSAGP